MSRNVNCAVFKEPRAFIKILEIVSLRGILLFVYTENTWVTWQITQWLYMFYALYGVVNAFHEHVESDTDCCSKRACLIHEAMLLRLCVTKMKAILNCHL